MKKQVQLLLDVINKLTSSAVIQNSNAFFDELPVYFYSGLVHFSNKNKFVKEGYHIFDKDIVAGGSSVNSRMMGILKCAAELIERFSLFAFHPKNIHFGTRDEFLGNGENIDPLEFNPKVKNQLIGWVKGTKLNNNKEVFVPAQMVYLNYYNWAHKRHKERKFIQQVSNGGCFGFTKESAILRGIYELIERDAILTKYLANLPLYSIDISSVQNDRVSALNNTIKQYNFNNILIDTTGDLGIPTYISAAIDQSSIVPQVTFGAKASLHEISAIMGALEESHMGRTWVRYELLNRNGEIPKVDPNNIRTRLERAFYYADKKHSKSFFKSLHKKRFIPKKLTNNKDLDSDKKELSLLIELLTKKNIRIIAVDIKPSFLNEYPIYIYKVIMPDLQFLYLEEKNKNINMKRIESVCRFYGHAPPSKLQNIPHFLL